MLNPIQDKPPASAYPVTDRIIGAFASAVLLATMLCFASTGGRTREAHYISHEADKPIAAAAAYQRPVETGRMEGLIEYHNPTPLSDELFRAVDAAADTYHVPLCLALGLIGRGGHWPVPDPDEQPRLADVGDRSGPHDARGQYPVRHVAVG